LGQQKTVYPESALEASTADGPLLAVQVANTEQRKRFVLMKVVPQSGSVVVVEAECDANRRPQWEAAFRQLLGTFELSDASDKRR
jgi:hypothetical protein